jgi:hypothetical protein
MWAHAEGVVRAGAWLPSVMAGDCSLRCLASLVEQRCGNVPRQQFFYAIDRMVLSTVINAAWPTSLAWISSAP